MSRAARRSTGRSPIPKGFGWDVLVRLDGDDLETHYRHTLEERAKRPGVILIETRPTVGDA
jgi:hypothetical protein